jgi:hypothetical protein
MKRHLVLVQIKKYSMLNSPSMPDLESQPAVFQKCVCSNCPRSRRRMRSLPLTLNYNFSVATTFMLASIDLSRRIHSRTKAGQFLSTDPFVSQAARNLIASGATIVTSFKSSAICPRSCSSRLARYRTCSDRIRPLNAKVVQSCLSDRC